MLECSIKRVSKLNHDFKQAMYNVWRILKQGMLGIIIAVIVNGALICCSYTYVHHLAYKQNTQIIEMEKYTCEKKSVYKVCIEK